MSIKIRCTTCGKELEIPDSFAGKKGKCPFCLEVLDVPLPGQSQAAPAAGQAAPKAPAPPVPEPEPPPAAPEARKPASVPLPARARKVRMPLIAAAAVAVVLAVGGGLVYMHYNSQPTVSSKKLSPPVAPPAEGTPEAPGPAKVETVKSAAPEQEPEVKQPAAAEEGRFADTRRVAGGFPARTPLYVEIRHPKQFFEQVGELPAWADKAAGRARSLAAWSEICRTIAYGTGQKAEDVEALLSGAQTVHAAIGVPGEPPVFALSLAEPATREKLFANLPSMEFVDAVEFDGIPVERFSRLGQGEMEKAFYIAYGGPAAFFGSRYDVVQNCAKRLRDEAADSLLNHEGFTQALATREAAPAWVYAAPAAVLRPLLVSDALPSWVRLAAEFLQIEQVSFVQAGIDPGRDSLGGSMSAGGLLTNLLGGRPAALGPASFAPEGAIAYAAVAPKDWAQVWQQMESALGQVLPEQLKGMKVYGEAVQVDPQQDIFGSFGGAIGLFCADNFYGPYTFVAQVADQPRLKAACRKINDFAKLAPEDHKGYMLVSTPGNSTPDYALGEKALIVSDGREAVEKAIATAGGGASLAASPSIARLKERNPSAAVLLDMSALLGMFQTKEPVLSPKAPFAAAAWEHNGAIRFAGDAGIAAGLCAWFTGAVQAKMAAERVQETTEGKQLEQCRLNLREINGAVNKYVAEDLEAFQYPKTLQDVMAKGLLTDPKLLVCPADQAPDLMEGGFLLSYAIIFDRIEKQVTAGFSTKAILAWDVRENHNGKHLAIFVDERVQELTPEELEQEINKAIKEAATNVPRKIKLPK